MMDKKQFVSQSQTSNDSSGTSASGASSSHANNEIPLEISQMDFQTMKAASDTAKV